MLPLVNMSQMYTDYSVMLLAIAGESITISIKISIKKTLQMNHTAMQVT